MFPTGFGQNASGPGSEAEGPVGGQGDEPGGLQGAWGNRPSTDPGLPGLQGASLAANTPLKIHGSSIHLALPALICEDVRPHPQTFSHAATVWPPCLLGCP